MTPVKRARWFRLKLKALVRNRKVSSDAKILWIEIESFAAMDGTRCHPKVETLMKDLGWCKKTVQKYLRELKDLDLIEVRKHPTANGWVNLYTVKYPLTPLEGEGSFYYPRGRVKKLPTIGYQGIGTSHNPPVPDDPQNVVPFTSKAATA